MFSSWDVSTVASDELADMYAGIMGLNSVFAPCRVFHSNITFLQWYGHVGVTESHIDCRSQGSTRMFSFLKHHILFKDRFKPFPSLLEGYFGTLGRVAYLDHLTHTICKLPILLPLTIVLIFYELGIFVIVFKLKGYLFKMSVPLLSQVYFLS